MARVRDVISGPPMGEHECGPSHSDTPECRMCGHCCGPYFALYVEEQDERRWESEGRLDILDRLEWERNRVLWDGAAPYNSETGDRFDRCHFLEAGLDGAALCSIHSTKPMICRDYPPGSSEICVLLTE